ncbi:glycosyltransferase family 1 protein [Flavicella sediminum]|uniref:glycosyltransferase family 1 protein n=1 Tax=Flavicella sediminum TaxID=2585141 RepID=UPI001120A82C|nr:glycosyltransferase family 1 protein [Flavicella sediminum]
MLTTLHIVSFDVPYPPNYGGVIDVFYKLKSLQALGIQIILHTYEYGRGEQEELNKYCKEVHYYKRNNSLKNILSRKPFIVKTRSSENLLNRLRKDHFPILFEGLHTTFPLTTNLLKNRITLVRTHNIEHDYYSGLAKSESSKRKKVFFETEAKKLSRYERILKKANYILTISLFEHEYFKNKFGNKAIYTPVFFNHNEQLIKSTSEKFALWHGDLRVSDNQKALLFMIQVFKKLKSPLVVASSSISDELLSKLMEHPNIRYERVKDNEHMNQLLQSAHVHPLVSYQKTGIKLRLLNILTQGKFIVANNEIIDDTGLENCCYKANTLEEFRAQITKLLAQEYTNQEFEQRKELLKKFDPLESAKKIIALLK